MVGFVQPLQNFNEYLITVMTDIAQLQALAKQSSQSFHQQRNFIKKVLAGKIGLCPQCQQPLKVHLTGSGESSICCVKKCTDIALECE